MKIGLNATCFNDRPSGARQRFIGIYTELFKLLKDDEFVVFEPVDCRISSWFDKPENVVFKQTPLLSDSRLQKYFRGLWYWPSVLKAEQFDLFEGFHQPAVYAPTGHTLLTIHDIRRISQNEHWHWRERLVYSKLLERSLKSADLVIGVSESAKNEILDLYPNVSMSVIYNGTDIESFQDIPESELLKVQQHFNLPENFLLSVGHFEKRKNYLYLIDAVYKLHEKGHLVNLVIIGNDSGELAAVNDKVHSLQLSNYVKIFNGLTDLEVRCFYRLCQLFVFPSSYEGFGIPVIEAMAAGCPLVLSDIPVFQEITQGQGQYFSDYDPGSIANVVDAVLKSNSEINRLVQYGNSRAKDFSFTKIAGDLGRVYKSIQ